MKSQQDRGIDPADQERILPFMLKYGPLLGLICALIFVVNFWQMLSEAFYSKPVIMRGLGGLELSLLGIEAVVIVSSSLVVGIGLAFIYWMLKQGQLPANQAET